MSEYPEPTQEELEDLLHAQTMLEDIRFLKRMTRGSFAKNKRAVDDLVTVFNFAVRIVTSRNYEAQQEVINELEEFFR